MKKLIGFFLLYFSMQLIFAQALDSSRIEFFFRAGGDQTKEIVINPTPNSDLNDAHKTGLHSSAFFQGSLGLVFQKPNGWGFGLVYSFFDLPEVAFLKNEYLLVKYPKYRETNEGNFSFFNPAKLGGNFVHFLSIHLEHSFQKKFWFVRPFVELGIARVNFEGFRSNLKKMDENKFLEAQVNLKSRFNLNSTLGLDIGVRFLRDIFSISFTPALANYNWNWTLEERSIDPVGRQTLNSQNFSSNQTRFIFMSNLGCRIPLDLKF